MNGGMPNDMSTTLENLQKLAATQHPQRKDRFERYRLVRLTRDVEVQMSLAFKRGEYALAVDQDMEPGRMRCEKYITVWSRRNKVDTSVRAADVEWLS